MSLFTSGREKREVRTAVFKQVFKAADNPELYDAAILSIAYLQSSASLFLAPVIETERLILRFLAKMKTTALDFVGAYGSIPPFLLYSTGRKLVTAILNNDADAVKKVVLMNGFFRQATSLGLMGAPRIKYPAPLTEQIYNNVKTSGLVDNFFLRFGVLDEVQELLSGMTAVNLLLYPIEPEIIAQAEQMMTSFMSAGAELMTKQAEAEAQKQIELERMAKMQEFTRRRRSVFGLGGVDPGAALAVLGTVPVLGEITGVFSFVKGLFGGKEKQKIAEQAAEEALSVAEKWKHGYNVLLVVPQVESADTVVVQDILNRAQLYSPVNIHGDDMERYIGLPFMGLAYLVVLGRETDPPVEREAVADLPEEMPPVEDPELILEETKKVITEKNKQWVSAAAMGGGILLRLFGVF